MSSQMQTNITRTMATYKEASKIIKDSTSTNKQLLTEMTEIFDQMKKMTLTLITNNEKVENLLPFLKEKEIKMENQTQEDLNKIDEFKNKMLDIQNATINKLSICDSHIKCIDTNVTKSIEMNHTKDEKLVANVKVVHDEFKIQTNLVNNQLDAMFHEITNINDMADINISGGLNDLVSECETAKARIADDLCNFHEMNTNIESLQKEFQNDLAKSIDTCEQRLNTFKASELSVYKPSGETPSKTTYTYPRKLVLTSPHPKILEEFWQNHDGSPLECSAIVDEVDAEQESQEEIETTANEFSMNTVSDSTLVNDATSRTLNEIYNLNAISTPVIDNDPRKAFSLMQMNLNNDISQIKVRLMIIKIYYCNCYLLVH